MKLKEIGGTGTKQWNMMFNALLHAESYQSRERMFYGCIYIISSSHFVYSAYIAVLDSCLEVYG